MNAVRSLSVVSSLAISQELSYAVLALRPIVIFVSSISIAFTRQCSTQYMFAKERCNSPIPSHANMKVV